MGVLVGQPMNELYCAAKFAVEGYSDALATYLEPFFGIRLTVVEPGGIATEFGTSVRKKLEETGGIREDPYRPVLLSYLGRMEQRRAESAGRASPTADEVAEVIERVIAFERPPLRIRTSEWAEELCRFKTSADPDGLAQTQMVRDMMLLE